MRLRGLGHPMRLCLTYLYLGGRAWNHHHLRFGGRNDRRVGKRVPWEMTSVWIAWLRCNQPRGGWGGGQCGVGRIGPVLDWLRVYGDEKRPALGAGLFELPGMLSGDVRRR